MVFDKYSQQGNVFKFKAKVKYPDKDKIIHHIIIPVNISYTNEKEVNYSDINCDNNNCIDFYFIYECSLQIESARVSKVKFNGKNYNNKYSLSHIANKTKVTSSQKENDNKNSGLLDRININFLEHDNISLKLGRHFEISGDLDSNFASDNIKLILSKNIYRRDLTCEGYKDTKFPYNYFLDCDSLIHQ